MIREGCGAELVPAIREESRAIVFISVPWSMPERLGRVTFFEACNKFEKMAIQLGISFFRLEVDEDKISQHWLSSQGYGEFATYGAGSLLWVEVGKVISAEVNLNGRGANWIIVRSLALWPLSEHQT